ncbi:hypothetical protein BH11MYX4_BH11MYX4_67980 [soil metagenome]
MPARPVRVIPGWCWWTGLAVVTASALWLTQRAYLHGLPAFLDRIWQSDKVIHFVIAGLLAFFLDGALGRRAAFAIRGIAVPLAAVVVLVPTGIEECLQTLSALRTASFWDYAGDLAGVVVFIPLSRRFAR